MFTCVAGNISISLNDTVIQCFNPIPSCRWLSRDKDIFSIPKSNLKVALLVSHHAHKLNLYNWLGVGAFG